MTRTTTIALLITALFWVLPLKAAEDGYKFKSTGDVKSESDKVIKFTDSSNPKSDEVTEVEALTYPKHEFTLSLNPMMYSLRNEITSSRIFTGSNSTTYQNYGLSYQWDKNLGEYAGIDFRYFRIYFPDSNDRNGQNIFVRDSNAEMFVLKYYQSLACSVGDSAYDKACIGYQVNYDSIAALDYPTDKLSEIHVNAIQDFTTGLHAILMGPFVNRSSWFARGEANFGFGLFQNKGFQDKAVQRYNFQMGVETPFAGMFAKANLGMEYTTADMKSSGTIWKSNLTSYILGLALRWEWGSN